MKVLYALLNYPQLSETYIEAEMEYAIDRGVDVHVWAPLTRHPDAPTPRPVDRGPFAEVLRRVKPDVVHIHWLVAALSYAEQAAPLPVTVRGHSFDFSVARAARVAAIPNVKRIYLFPHFAAACQPSPKITPLPVAFSPRLHYPAPTKTRSLVLHLGAGLPGKGIDDFIEIARRCPEHEFLLGVARAGGPGEGFVDELRKRIHGVPVRILTDVPREEAAQFTRMAGIYIHTSDPKSHPFGMSISIAESMATGAFVLVRDREGVRDYVAGGAAIYPSVDEAVGLVNGTVAWDEPHWTRTAFRATDRAARFQAPLVLERLITDWASLAE